MFHIDVDVYPVKTFCLVFFKDQSMPRSITIVDDYAKVKM